MKTLLFICFSSLGIVLVLSQGRQPCFSSVTKVCKLTKAGREYDGPLSITRSGLTCQRWTSDQPHSNRFRESTLFPEGNAVAAGNKCRNPDSNYTVGVWCYTTNPDKRWEDCDVPFCNCRLTEAGRDYAGPLNVTRSGRKCQRWTSNQPHKHDFGESKLFPDGSAEAAGNKCRNPDSNYTEGVWCYTTSPDKRWEECDVPLCNCKLTKAGRDYDGPLSTTQSGRTCQRWTSNQPHKHDFGESKLFPDGSAKAAGNKCRNPDSDYNDGVWCYTTDPDKRWEECDVPFCNCRLTKAGREYDGPLNKTQSGLTCQPWTSDKPHNHRFRESKLFPEGSAEAAGNKCRNPDLDHPDGVWCYTTSPDKRWELCDVPLCS